MVQDCPGAPICAHAAVYDLTWIWYSPGALILFLCKVLYRYTLVLQDLNVYVCGIIFTVNTYV
jgi:hypothetical protein